MTAATPSRSTTEASALVIKPLSSFTGAECTGVDLANLKAGEWDRLREAYGTYSILVVRDQQLSKPDQIAFSERFGELELPIRADYLGKDYPALHVVSNLGKDGKPNPKAALDNPGNFFWHTDASYMQRPASSTLLYAIEIPPSGGDTLFANMHAAYDALSTEMKQRIDGLRAVHSWEQSRHNSGSRPASAEEIAAAPPVAHPLVRTHPKTGRKGLYLGNHTSHIEGMPIEEGRALLKQLLEHTTQAQFIYRHQWLTGDIVIWDNRSLMHKASDDFDMGGHVRRLHRTVVQGDVPR
ncbi:TauD/TfdA dioxygenase family protein [Hydrogenophaga sp. BPS33]|uniref:TauD/TfdA dioxygenase family protein n=1 Tax=Hydrogenophaga sp. BPS33 TaxID=2651974 RepID=UPI00131F4AAD|nr:TauD/TfdA family dioxygenase [Hydrogenophaga sp. BPS33]QHE83401.1 TauD/TfdA family dioxygenase [Hydrogenophaga sp. BPS33]